MLRQMLEDSGYMEMRRTEKTPEAEGRIENLRELVGEFKSNYDTFEQYLEYISLVMDNDNAATIGDHVSVMTLHAAKGLEFDVVFLPGWEEEIFPNKKAMDEGNTEEERRLAYVGITRAKKRVYITFAGSRRIFNQWQNNLPSRFINEIPEEHVEMTNLSAGGGYDYGYNDWNGGNRSYFYKKEKKRPISAIRENLLFKSEQRFIIAGTDMEKSSRQTEKTRKFCSKTAVLKNHGRLFGNRIMDTQPASNWQISFILSPESVPFLNALWTGTIRLCWLRKSKPARTKANGSWTLFFKTGRTKPC